MKTAAKEIPLTQGKYALVDAEDFERLSKYKWCAHVGRHIYAVCSQRVNGKRKHIPMHKIVLGVDKEIIDHINRNTLDNRKCNLRKATWQQNMWNRGPSKSAVVPYKGVSYSKANERYYARLRLGNKIHNLGYYDTAEEAAIVFNKAAKKYHGEFAYLNKVP